MAANDAIRPMPFSGDIRDEYISEKIETKADGLSHLMKTDARISQEMQDFVEAVTDRDRFDGELGRQVVRLPMQPISAEEGRRIDSDELDKRIGR